MNTQTFLNTLNANLNKELLFEYAPDKFVNANYHITEIKNLIIDSVDCGGKANTWKETIVQLWENPLEIGKRSYITTTKAVEIFDRVNSIKPLYSIYSFEGKRTLADPIATANQVAYEISISQFPDKTEELKLVE